MRGDRTFAYDLVMRYGAVSGRVVLLLRSAEAKPPSLSSVFLNTPIELAILYSDLKGMSNLIDVASARVAKV